MIVRMEEIIFGRCIMQMMMMMMTRGTNRWVSKHCLIMTKLVMMMTMFDYFYFGLFWWRWWWFIIMIHVIGAVCEDQECEDICQYERWEGDNDGDDGDSEEEDIICWHLLMKMVIVLNHFSIYSFLFINCILSNQVCSSTKRRARKTRSGRTVPSCWSTDASTQ